MPATTREELADLLESEDLETEILSMSGALVIDSDDARNFIEEFEKLFKKYSYLEQFNFHFVSTETDPIDFIGINT